MIDLIDIYKIYFEGQDNEVRALNGINLHINEGEFVALMGQSGSGKSTCMNIIGCLDVPTYGEYIINGESIESYNENQLARFRNKTLGFIFQQYNLIGKLNILENVELPLVYGNYTAKERRQRALAALERVGLQDRVKHFPNELSGGQQQRASIARALVGQPKLMLADEPTGALDSKTGIEILHLLQELNRDDGCTVVLITHDPGIATYAKRTVRLQDGTILSDTPNEAKILATVAAEGGKES